MAVVPSLFDAPAGPVLPAASQWVTGTLFGDVAAALCVIAVAVMGILLMIGRLSVRDAIAYCESIRDSVSRRLFTDILDSEEEHIDWIETQLALIELIGEQNYLLTKIEELSNLRGAALSVR